MKRSKLAVTSLPAPPTSTWYEAPRCFACDDPIKSHRFSTSLQLGKTQYTNSSIPGKLGEYIGDGFMVIVTSDDALCRNCMNLLNTMDRLEEELKEHRSKLLGNLRRKYGLDSDENSTTAKINSRQQFKAVEEDSEVIEVYSDEEWTPNNKRRKVTSSNTIRAKGHCCSICKLEFIDLNHFMIHLDKHKEQNNGLSGSADIKVENNTPENFKCGFCSLSFDKKEVLASHMRLHTGDKQINRPINIPSTQTGSSGKSQSLLKRDFAPTVVYGNKSCPEVSSQTVVEMKLIMEGETKKNSKVKVTEKPKPIYTPQNTTFRCVPKIPAAPIPKVVEKDSGGKVCLLALWNGGECTDLPNCQTCSPRKQPQPTPLSQAEVFIPEIVVKQTQDGVPELVFSHSDLTQAITQSPFKIAPPVSQQNLPVLSNVTQAGKQCDVTQQLIGTQIDIEISDSNQASPSLALFMPDLNSDSQMKSLEPSFAKQEMPETEKTSDVPPKLDLSTDQEQSFENVQTGTQLPINKLDDILNPSIPDEINVNNQSNNIENILTQTITEPNEISNIPTVNLKSDEESHIKDELDDWLYEAQQANNIIMPEKDTRDELWIKDRSKTSVDQLDGTQCSNSRSSYDFNDQHYCGSVDETEQSDFFTSRYAVDTERMRREADAFADALLAAIKS